MKIIDRTQSYTFSKYFEMGISAQDLAKEFEYSFTRKNLDLPEYEQPLDKIEELKSRIKNTLPYVSSTNETARREIFISPIIIDLIYYTKSEVRIEYNIKVNEQLQGNLDYLIQNKNNLLVIEAKKADLDCGMTQLFAELIALDLWLENQEQIELVGSITTGNIWQFAQLNRQEKHLEQGLNLYRVPEDLEPLMRILVQCLI